MLFLPDTPRWYYAQGHEAEGDKTLCQIFDAEIHDERIQNMKSSILTSIAFESQNEKGFNLLDLIWDRSDLRVGRRIRISFLILAIQQMMGTSISCPTSFLGVAIKYCMIRNQSFRLLQHGHFWTSRLVAVHGSVTCCNHEHVLCSWSCPARLDH